MANYLKDLPKDLKIIIIGYVEDAHDVLHLNKVIKLKNDDFKNIICNKYNINLKNFSDFGSTKSNQINSKMYHFNKLKSVQINNKIHNIDYNIEFDFKQLYIETLSDKLSYGVDWLDESKKIDNALIMNKHFFPNRYVILFLVLNGNIGNIYDIFDPRTPIDENNLFVYLLNRFIPQDENYVYSSLASYLYNHLLPYLKYQFGIITDKSNTRSSISPFSTIMAGGGNYNLSSLPTIMAGGGNIAIGANGIISSVPNYNFE